MASENSSECWFLALGRRIDTPCDDVAEAPSHLEQVSLQITHARALHASGAQPIQLAPALVEFSEESLDLVLP